LLLPLSIVFIRYYPAWGRAYGRDGVMMFTGVTTQKNTLGEFVCVVGLVLLWNCLERPRLGTKRESLWKQWDRVLLLAMGLWLLNASQSKTALLCLVVGGVLLIRLRWLTSRTARGFAFASALSVPFLILSSQQFSSTIAPILEALGRNATFTGRTDIWQHITLKTVNPLIGEGFWNFWGGPGGVVVSHAMHVVAVPNAHCGYMDIYLDGGAIGVTLLLGLLIACGRRFTKLAASDNFQALRFAFLVAMILYNNSESTFARPSTSWFTMLLLTVELSVGRSGTRAVSSHLAVQKEPQRAVSRPEWVISE
jgi:O-antigen ligase